MTFSDLFPLAYVLFVHDEGALQLAAYRPVGEGVQPVFQTSLPDGSLVPKSSPSE